MREIKFRAWDLKRKEMRQVQLMDWSDWWVSTGHTWERNNSLEYGERNSFQNSLTDRHILMQYTGHRDQIGKEIYDGDIVHVVNVLTTAFGTEPYDAVIEWDKYRWCMRNLNPNALAWGQFPLNNLDPFGLDITVIGNVYENPELLDGETRVV